MSMRNAFAFLFLFFNLSPFFGQTILCDTSSFVFNHFMRVTAASGVNLRAAPSSKAAKLLTIPYGTEILAGADDGNLPWETIEGKYTNWWRVSYAGKTGYVFGGFLEDIHEKTSIRLLIPNAGVESLWESMRLDPAVTWFALVPSEKELPEYQSQVVQMHRLRVKLGAEKTGYQDEVRHLPLNVPENTAVFFSGFEPGTQVEAFYRRDEPDILFPGTVIPFHVYDEKQKLHRIYQVYATGDAVQAPPGRGYWPFSGIRNYQLRVREIVDSPTGPDDRYAVASDQLLFSGNLVYDLETGRINGPRPFLLGDFDNDRKLDIILNRNDYGTVFYLFLSSKALPGFMMRVVAMVADAGC